MIGRRPRYLAIVALAGAAPFLAGASLAAEPPVTSPEAELASFNIRDGYNINLFASEEDGVANPIQIRFDHRGRIYVACSWIYPHVKPDQPPNDKIFILEDTNHDGRSDKTTLFADGLHLPLGLELGHDGVYVGEGTQLVHLRDTDGDDRADERRVILRGFGTGDSHQNINSFVWGPGGDLFFSQGLHAFSKVETPWGIETLHEAGVWRLEMRRLKLSGFFGDAMPPHNPWGTVFYHWGQPIVFAGNGHGVFYLTPEMIKSDATPSFGQIWNKGLKFCGADLVESSGLPDELQGAFIAGGFINNMIFCLTIENDGAGFKVTDLPPLLTSTSTSFRPVDVKIGPDGAIYIADWFNPIIGHYQTSFRHPDRDRSHGRIWRITPDNFMPAPNLSQKNPSLGNLLNALKSKERWDRYHAKRLLASMPTEPIIDRLDEWIDQLDASDPRYEHHLFEALGVYESHEVIRPDLLARLLESTVAEARAYATRVIGQWQDRLPDPLSLIARQIRDPHPRVRLEAIVAASYIPSARSIEIATAALEAPVDRFIEHALVQATHALKPHWLPAFVRGELELPGDTALHFVLNTAGAVETLPAIRRQLEAGDLRREAKLRLLAVLADMGTIEDHRSLLDEANFSRSGRYEEAVHAAAVRRLAESIAARNIPHPPDAALLLRPSLESSSHDMRAAAAKVAAAWKLDELLPSLIDQARQDESPVEARIEYIRALGAFDETAPVLKELAQSVKNPRLQVAAALALARGDLAAGAEVAAFRLHGGGLDPGDTRALVQGFLALDKGDQALASALDVSNLSPSTGAALLEVMAASGKSSQTLAEVAAQAAGLDANGNLPSETNLQPFIDEVVASGNPARGADIFQRPTLGCAACHSLDGSNVGIGPDLSAIGTGQPVDFIIGAILKPNREVKEGYMAVEVTTKDGRIIQGYEQNAGAGEVAVRDIVSGEVERLAKASITEKRQSGSVMPEGLVNHLSRDEFRDLIAYLSQLGKRER